MADTGFFGRMAAQARVRPEALNVAPDLVGMPLAPHGRRALAVGLDALVVGLLSSTGMFWVVAGIGALVIQLRRPQPARASLRRAWTWGALALLVVIVLQHGLDWIDHRNDVPRVSASADDEEDDAVIAAAASASTGAGMLAQTTVLSARVAALEAELAQARKPAPLRWRDEAMRRLHRWGLSFGWAIAYFSLLPFWWEGQTVGKRVFGLRVVELTGRPLGLMDCFSRYGGYAAGLATGGVGFLQILWDPNRQAVEDKLAHTVVVDLRAPRGP